MDLGAVGRRLARREYASPGDFCADMRRIFSNSRLYNTNKRSRVSVPHSLTHSNSHSH